MERSKKIVFVSHCLLNQNVRAVGKANYPGAIRELMTMLTESGIGIVQLPCPQVEFDSGLHRKHKAKKISSGYTKSCQKLSTSVLKQIEDYMNKKYKIVGILGVELSGTCGVHQIVSGTRAVPGKGLLIQELEEQMHKKNYQVPIIGVDLNNVYTSIEKIHQMLKYY